MNIRTQLIALYTLFRREFVRMFRISTQVFLPPVITTGLYFLIFGTLVGRRIGSIEGVSYSLFITPGLVIMSVISNSYSNVSSSLFTMRFQKSIEELLVSPMLNSFLLLGYVLGGIFRGFVVACCVFFIASFFVHIEISHLGLSLLIILLVAAIFSLAGFFNALIAKNFDDIMLIPTFVLTPLTYLGGIFYSTNMLSPFWQTISYLNPILYIVNALRYAMINQHDVDITTAMGVIIVLFSLLILLNSILLKKGVGLRE